MPAKPVCSMCIAKNFKLYIFFKWKMLNDTEHFFLKSLTCKFSLSSNSQTISFVCCDNNQTSLQLFFFLFCSICILQFECRSNLYSQNSKSNQTKPQVWCRKDWLQSMTWKLTVDQPYIPTLFFIFKNSATYIVMQNIVSEVTFQSYKNCVKHNVRKQEC